MEHPGFNCVDDLSGLKRKELQGLCKNLHIKANSKNVKLIQDLSEYFSKWNEHRQGDLEEENKVVMTHTRKIDCKMVVEKMVVQNSPPKTPKRDPTKEYLDNLTTPTANRNLNHTPRSGRRTWKESPIMSSIQKLTRKTTTTPMRSIPKQPIFCEDEEKTSSYNNDKHVPYEDAQQEERNQSSNDCHAMHQPPSQNQSDMRASILDDMKRIIAEGRVDSIVTSKSTPSKSRLLQSDDACDSTTTTEKKFLKLHKQIKFENIVQEKYRKELRKKKLTSTHSKWNRLSKAKNAIQKPKSVKQDCKTKTSTSAPHKQTKQRKLATKEDKELVKKNATDTRPKHNHNAVLKENAKKRQNEVTVMQETNMKNENNKTSIISTPLKQRTYPTKKAKYLDTMGVEPRRPFTPNRSQTDEAKRLAKLRRERQLSYKAPRPRSARKATKNISIESK
eukprot:m.14905 g.14905  ORF g.14905 m.14905 type:complete len:447 (+) comp4391_c0_seq2:171-1511(+)